MKTILILEDEPCVMNLLRWALKDFDILEASTAAKTIEHFSNRKNLPIKLLIADVSIAECSGIQVGLILRSKVPKLPIILISGYPRHTWNDQDCEDVQRLGADSVTILEKPFRYKQLSNAVYNLIGLPESYAAKTATGLGVAEVAG